MIVAKGVATFSLGGAETASFTWVDVITLAPVTFANPPISWAPSVQLTTPSQGAGLPYLASPVTTTGGTFTMANPSDCTVTVVGLGS